MPLLLCDLDDTLIDRSGAFARWAHDFALRHGIGEEHLAWMVDLDNDGYVDRPSYLAALRQRFDLDLSVPALVAEYHDVYPRFVLPPAPEARAALCRLRKAGWRIGIVTNGEPSQEAKLDHAGLKELIDGWAISSVVGHRKPDPQIYRAAADLCGARLDGAWMVGDYGPSDIAGAVALGLTSVWLRRGRSWPFTAYAPTHEADSFAEAAALALA